MYRRALEVDPQAPYAWSGLVWLRKMTPADGAWLERAEEIAASGLTPIGESAMRFAIGKYCDDVGDFKGAFQSYERANELHKMAATSYDRDARAQLVDDLMRVYTREAISNVGPLASDSMKPIFVVGMPRSGTTLIEQIIASHPLVHGAGELGELNEVVLTVRGPDGDTIPYPEFVPALDAAALKQIGARYVASVRKLMPEGTQARYLTDKMPSNYYFAGLIHLALPNARIVHTVRDPVDTCISCFSKLFSAEQNHTYDLGELGRYHKRYQRLMDHWRGVLPAGRILDVRCEDVVADLEGEAQRIIAYCGLPWDKRCLSFHETNRPIRTASATQVRRPIYSSAVGRWRVYEQQIGPLLTALGLKDAPRRGARGAARQPA